MQKHRHFHVRQVLHDPIEHDVPCLWNRRSPRRALPRQLLAVPDLEDRVRALAGRAELHLLDAADELGGREGEEGGHAFHDGVVLVNQLDVVGSCPVVPAIQPRVSEECDEGAACETDQALNPGGGTL